MNVETLEIKDILHRLIVETDDIDVLGKVQSYFLSLRSKNVDWWETISDNEKEMVETGLQQLKAGQGIPHEEVRKKVRKLLEE